MTERAIKTYSHCTISVDVNADFDVRLPIPTKEQLRAELSARNTLDEFILEFMTAR